MKRCLFLLTFLATQTGPATAGFIFDAPGREYREMRDGHRSELVKGPEVPPMATWRFGPRSLEERRESLEKIPENPLLELERMRLEMHFDQNRDFDRYFNSWLGDVSWTPLPPEREPWWRVAGRMLDLVRQGPLRK